MKTSYVPVGLVTASVRTLGPKETQLCPLGSNYVSVGRGGMYTIPINGWPVIIATAGWKMILGHAADANIVDEIRRVFLQKCGVPAEKVVMCMQFATPDLESSFIEKACEIGLKHVWAMHSLRDHPHLASSRILVRRNLH